MAPSSRYMTDWSNGRLYLILQNFRADTQSDTLGDEDSALTRHYRLLQRPGADTEPPVGGVLK
jgi:hypothetical protein